MVYWWFEEMNPLFIVFVLCPLIAVLIGVCWYTAAWCSRTIALGVSFLLPLLYITTDWMTFTANLGAWLMYGIMYGLITWAAYRLLCTFKGYKS
ncbi:hypothetical protein [Paenibacillus sp. FSL R7-0652]|uniref:hypothetical protein n=1 Tax=Paenibacillus sp. FSL R7-0652 TaxID=2921687 RepID=UPI00315A89CC